MIKIHRLILVCSASLNVFIDISPDLIELSFMQFPILDTVILFV